MSNRLKIAGLSALAALAVTSLPAWAQDATATPEVVEAVVATAVPLDMVFIMNSLIMMIGGILVFWMAAGFAMLEVGLVRSKNVTMQLVKNIGLFAIACFMYYLVGYSIMYPGDDWLIANVFGKFGTATLEVVGLTADAASDYSYASTSSDFFF